MQIEELLKKANSLPMTPGVYIMHDKNGKIIYVGKSAKLKNRVTSYFRNGEKTIKTKKMVSLVDDFEFILCDTEIEALSLENSLIKKHTPRYNIKLKDSKSYPYIKLTSEEYPRFIMTRQRMSDKGKYFGPYTGTATVFSLLSLLNKTLGIPNCKLKFPRDIGKDRACIYYQMKQCCGLCLGNISKEEYQKLIDTAIDILKGNTKIATENLEKRMYLLAEQERFEEASKCRDTINALNHTKEKQKVVANPEDNHDTFAIYHDELSSCVSVFSVREGRLVGKNDFLFGADKIVDEDAFSSIICDYYKGNGNIPKRIDIDFRIDAEIELISSLLSQISGTNIEVRVPEKGDAKKLCDLCYTNAKERAGEYNRTVEKDNEVLIKLAEMLGLECIPSRIEAIDISNLSSEHKTAGIITFVDGKPYKNDYRIFNIKSVEGTDDYASMSEAIKRRMLHLGDNSGNMSDLPDLLLLDGGKGHVSTIKNLLSEMNINIPVFGMVKDDFHKTRALCTENEEISIAKEQSVFTLIYKIQEEVHRFTVSKMQNAKRSTLKHSSLEKIDGIGESKAKILLSTLKSVKAIKEASIDTLCEVKGISRKDAENIYRYFRK